jgi:transposase-like protein
VRWYLRFRLSYADVAELLAERGLRVDPSTVFDWVREFAPLYEDAARQFRRAVGSSWSVDETYTTIAGSRPTSTGPSTGTARWSTST